jgi:MarR family 2-MHQ and catechol resistance regulon transcriptional repressor
METADALHDPLLTTFGHLVEAYTRVESTLGASLAARCGIPHVWFEVLLRLARSPDGRLTMGELADQIALTSGGVTRLVDRMRSAGYLDRTPCPNDRRVSYAVITETGRDRLAAAAEVHATNLRTVFSRFTPSDMADLERLLDLLHSVPVHTD